MVSPNETGQHTTYHIPGEGYSFAAPVSAAAEVGGSNHEWDAATVASLLGHIGSVLSLVRENPDAPELPIIPAHLLTQEDVDLAV